MDLKFYSTLIFILSLYGKNNGRAQCIVKDEKRYFRQLLSTFLMWMLHSETNYVRQIPRKHLLQCPKFHSFLGFRRLWTSVHHGVHSWWKVFLCMGFWKVMYGAWAVAIVLRGSFGVYWCWQRSRTFHITVTQGCSPPLVYGGAENIRNSQSLPQDKQYCRYNNLVYASHDVVSTVKYCLILGYLTMPLYVHGPYFDKLRVRV